MNKKLFNIVEITIVLIFFIISFRIIKEKEILRFFLEVISMFLFLIITEIYKRKKFFDVGYIYYLIVIVINMSISSYYFTTQKIFEIYGNKYPLLKDYFNLYFTIYILVSILILGYLLISSKQKIDKKFQIKIKNELSVFIVGIIVALPLALNFSTLGNMIFIPILNSFFIIFLLDKKKKKIKYLFYLLISILAISPYIANRFRVLIFIFPLILTCILYIVLSNKSISYKKIILLIFTGILLILLYGVISEIIKLNIFYGRNLKIGEILLNIDKLFIFLEDKYLECLGFG